MMPTCPCPYGGDVGYFTCEAYIPESILVLCHNNNKGCYDGCFVTYGHSIQTCIILLLFIYFNFTVAGDTGLSLDLIVN